MARVPIVGYITSPVNGSAMAGVEVTITKHVSGKSAPSELGTGEAATIYLGETTSEHTATNTVLTDSKGGITQGAATNFAEYWLPLGSYDFKVSGAGLTTYYVVKQMLSAEAGAIGEEQLGEETVSTSRISARAVTSAKIALSLSLEGTPKAPTAARNTNTEQLATTAFVAAMRGLELVESEAAEIEAAAGQLLRMYGTGTKIVKLPLGETGQTVAIYASTTVTIKNVHSGGLYTPANGSSLHPTELTLEKGQFALCFRISSAFSDWAVLFLGSPIIQDEVANGALLVGQAAAGTAKWLTSGSFINQGMVDSTIARFVPGTKYEGLPGLPVWLAVGTKYKNETGRPVHLKVLVVGQAGLAFSATLSVEEQEVDLVAFPPISEHSFAGTLTAILGPGEEFKVTGEHFNTATATARRL